MIPWGNAYYNTSACGKAGGYDRGATLTCWREKCGPNSTNVPSDCFTAKELCQHNYRTPECTADRREGCVTHYYPDPKQWLPFVVCYEAKGQLSKYNAEVCAKQANFDFDKIEACTTGALDQQITLMNAKKTLAYTGGWEGTPTVTVGNKNFAGNVDGLVKSICEQYTGTTKPAACSKQYFE